MYARGQRHANDQHPGPRARARGRKLPGLHHSALYALSAGIALPTVAGNLPVPCIAAGSCGANGPSSWVGAGAATATSVGNKLTVNQTTQNALLNWQSFNIAKGSSVNFVQPGATALAINQIFQGSPSQIFGSLTANGRIYLINQNGILFGAGAQVNTAGLVASTLNITQNAVANGIAQTLPSGDPTTPSFVPFTDASGNPLPSGPISVAQGATLNSTGGQIYLFAPNITNQGAITTPNGQTILAAGQAVYLATSPDPAVRGLMVAVDGSGTVTNGAASNAAVTDPSKLVGQIVAQHGNITLLGLAVNQQGLVSANTSVEENGSIYLIAANRTQGGTLTLGAHSVTEAGLDTSDTSKAVDQTAQLKSTVDLEGFDVNVLGGASITATSGTVSIMGSSAPVQGSTDVQPGPRGSVSDGSRIYIADGASIDVSGATATLPMSANVLQVQLRGSELADDPVQRNGALRGQTVNVDTRQYGTTNGTAWVGTPLANLTADVATIERGILQRNETGGSVTLQSSGDVIVGSGARINVSGGASDYQAGFLDVSTLIGADGKAYSITNASPNILYKGVANTTTVSYTDPRWGVTTTYNGIYGNSQGQWEPAYLQGADAGSLTLNAPHVIFAGALAANVEIGPFQRNPPTALPAGTLERPYDQLPLPAALDVGPAATVPNPFVAPDLIISGIDFASPPLFSSLRNADGTAFNPLTDPWPASVTDLMLNPALIGANAAGRVELDANGTVTLPAGVDLRLPVGGNFSALGSNIDIAGTITGPGAQISLQTIPTVANQSGPANITLGRGAALDVAGAWVNDNPAVTPPPATAPLAIDGGSVTLSARDGNITLAHGALIDVSGGAQLQANGTLVAGSAGRIAVSSSNPDFAVATDLTLGATLRGYGLSEGGSLSLSASAFCLTSGASCVPLASDGSTDGTVTLAPAFFSAGGFGAYTLNADFGGLELTSGTQLRPLQQNLVLPNLLMPSAPTLSSVASVAVLPPLQRQPVELSLSAQYVPAFDTEVTPSTFASAPSLSLDAGAAIVLDPRANLALTSNTRILDNGLIAVPGGSVSMTVTAALAEPEFIAGHEVWLGRNSIVDVSGTVLATTNNQGETQGSVLPGGSVALTALRGAVETQPGSSIDVSGTTGTLDVAQVNSSGVTSFHPTVIASAGGSVSIQAAEAALLSGTMQAASGSPKAVANGSFSLVLDGNERYGSTDFGSNAPPYPFTPRTVELASTQAPVVIASGADLPDNYDGEALVSATALTAAGFDAVTLRAGSFNSGAAAFTSTVAGQILFDGNLSLNLARSLTLDAASFQSTGGRATLAAPYVSLGQSTVPTQGVVGATGAGSGSLQVNAAMIDLIGNSAFGGFANVALDSRGDIRANGVEALTGAGAPLDPQLPGSITVSGALDLTAQQVYPSTLTAFTFTSGAAGAGNITIEAAPGTAAGPLLEAGGSLTFNAPAITQAGTVRAPVGSIIMNAPSVTLTAGSTTSTSADGQVIPFGETQGGFDWVYPSGGGGLVYGTDGIPLPSQSIQLIGSSVNIAKGATLDVKGGGNLLATEFIPGPTGTQDVLGGSGSFAILPTSSLQFAPYDPYYSGGSGVSPNESVYLSGGSGIPAGTYAVLPARYALLPGAYYVTPVAGYQDLSPAQQISQTDGSVIVSGYMNYAGTTLGASRTSGFDVRPGTAVQNLAQYTLTGANSFFTRQAANAGVTAQRLPQDAGYLALSASTQLTLNGALQAAPGSGGLGAEVDIASSAIRLVNGNAPPAPEADVLDISANSLTQLGAESILIGGTRSQTSTGLAITTDATTVEVANGATVRAPELLLAAANTVTVDDGATLAASGTVTSPATTLLLSGDGALLRVANGGNPVTTRSGTTGAQGQVALVAGSVINAPGGSVGVDVSASADFGGSLQLKGGSLSISGGEVSLGDVPAGTSGIVLPATVLGGLGLANLSLASRGSIDFYDGASLSGTNVSLSAGALRGFGQNGAQVRAGDTLTLLGSSTASPLAGTGTGTGTLALAGGSVVIGAGSLDLSGFSATSVSSTGLMNISGTGALSVGGSLNLEAGLLSADSGAERQISVAGSFAYNPTPNAVGIAPPAEQPLGAAVAITAQSIAFNGSARFNAGNLSLVATGPGGDINLGSAANIDLSAVKTVFDGLTVPSPAGTLSLQSQSGSVMAAAGSVINVSALDPSVANAGTLTVQAASGAANLAGKLLGSNADVSVDAQSLGSAGALEAALVAGGFTGDWNLRLRGPGDLVVPASAANAISGRAVTLTADQGNVDVEGTITSASASGGSITLSASNNVIVNGTLDARPQASGQMNGQIELASTQGGVLVGANATLEAYDPSVAVQSLADGGLWIRAPQTTLATLLPGSAAPAGLVLAGNLEGLRSITIEGFKTYTNSSGTLGSNDVAADMSNPLYADAANFMASAPALQQALAAVKGPAPQIVPGIEIDSNQTLTLTTDWDLSAWRFGGAAGVLTLRSAGDLNIDASLSDGFTGTTGAAAYVLTSTGPSWSYRLASGADLTSANPMAVQPLYQFQPGGALANGSYGTGSLTLAAGAGAGQQTMIRTGTGSIDIAAAGNVTLANQDSVIYTAGIADSGITFARRGQLGGLLYPTEGGDISISAGQDVVGALTPDLVTNWLWRVGTDALPRPTATAWTVNFVEFEQGVGALGGGNVKVTAGQDINDLYVSVPTVGRQVGSATPAGSDVQILNEGDIYVRAGNNVAGGALYDGSGSVAVVAGNQITQSPAFAQLNPASPGLYPIVLLGNATVTLSARSGATLAGVADPMLLPQGPAQSAGQGNNYSYFSTYGPSSSVTLQTTTGTVELVNDTSQSSALLTNYGSTLPFATEALASGYILDSQSALRIYPGTLTADSLRGGLTVDFSLSLWPEANGSLNLLAHDGVALGSLQGQSGFEIIESNADPTVLPTVTNPQGYYDNVDLQLDSVVNSAIEGYVVNAPVPVHLTGPTPDSTISRIVSLTGDVSMASLTGSQLTFAAPAQIVAGRDVDNLVVDFTNLESTDVSAVVAGRDITYSVFRDNAGALNPLATYINVDGPGTLDLVAGRDINLGTSNGVTSRGNIVDPGLAPIGASISVEAGVGAQGVQGYSTFINDYLAPSSTYGSVYASDLIAYMQPFLGGTPTAAQALSAFEALPALEQAPLVQQVFFDELLASGTAAAGAGALHGNFTRGYDAIEALFPNSVASLSGGKPDPYSGDITLEFSRIYTLDGGNINLLAPGGLINVGLAAPPAAFGITKPPSELGIVAQSTGDVNAYSYGDFEVNESRVFAADGGNIMIWSTQGNIDAGRGAKTAISAPPPTITYVNGVPTVVFPAALTGSGIQTLATSAGVSPGNVGLFAPNGVVNANDAGIVAGNLTIAATAVLGAGNIKVSGVAIGVPVEVTGLGASLAGVSAVGSSASQSATQSVTEASNRNASTTPVADATLGWLDVFLEGFGQDVCKANDADCLKRQGQH